MASTLIRTKRGPILPFNQRGEPEHIPKGETPDPEIHDSSQSRWSLFTACTRKFCESTSLHGLKYLTENTRPTYERVFWAIALGLVYSTVSFVIVDQVETFFRSPVLITFDSKSRSVEEIPFPAVTICSDNQIRPSVINLTQAFQNPSLLSAEMKKKFEYAAYVCKLEDPEVTADVFEPSLVHSMLETIYGPAACKELMLKMGWVSVPLSNPCNFLQPMVTTNGGCLAFNMLTLSHIFTDPDGIFKNWERTTWTKSIKTSWSPDTGFEEGGGAYPGPPPWKTQGSNMGNTAFFDLNLLSNDFEGICSREGKGFYVYIHNPAEMPSSSHAVIYIEENRETTVSAIPRLYITDPSLNAWSTENRGCYFQTERSLNYFKIYTQHNCELECEANYTLSYCQCVPFNYPRSLGTPICGPGKVKCLRESFENRAAMTQKISSVCDCLPSCSELQYEVKVTKATRKWNTDVFHSSNESYTAIKVKFQSKFFIGIKRTVLFTFTDFVANIGGLLGLFLGFSILSLVEVIYFILLRPCTNFARRKKIEKIQKRTQQIFTTQYNPRGGVGYPDLSIPVKRIRH